MPAYRRQADDHNGSLLLRKSVKPLIVEMAQSTISISSSSRLPSWFRQPLPPIEKINSLKQNFRQRNLHTVCESARCPNLGECWSKGVATFMILGDVCSRACRFCAVAAGRPLAVDPHEPQKLAETIQGMNLNYIVITSVTRDDLVDEGAGHFAETIRYVKKLNPQLKIEVLIPDFSARQELLSQIVDAQPEVVSHNVETVKRLSPLIRPQAQYMRSLDVLRLVKQMSPGIFVKSSFMVGLGETQEEIKELMQDLMNHQCDILTVGQYLAPTQLKRHVKVERFVAPQEFEELKQMGLRLGFKHVMSGPLVRSSYIAEEGYRGCLENLKEA